MSGSDWLGKFKSRAKSVQEAAINRVEKISQTLDQKIKEAQEDLERQRAAEASRPAAPTVKIWRPSADNPDGELIAETKPTPPPPPPSTIQKPVGPSPSIPIPSVQPPPETGQIATSSTPTPAPPPTPVDEPILIPRKRRPLKKLEHKSSVLEESDNHEELVQKLSNKLSEQTPRVDKLVENTADITIPPMKKPISIENSTSHSENNVNIEKQDTRPTKTELDQETVQTNISTVASMPSTTIDNPPIDHPSSKHTPVKISHDEQPAPTITDNLTLQNSNSEDTSVEAPHDEKPVTTITDDLPIENSGPEDTPVEVPRDEKLATTITDDLPIENSGPEDIPVEIPHDEQATLKNIDDLPIEHSSEENILMTKSNDDQLIPTTTDDLPIKNSDLEDTQIEISYDEQPALTSIDNLPMEDSDQEDVPVNKSSDEQVVMTNTNDLSAIDSRSENIPMDEPTDELTTSTNIEDSAVEQYDQENINDVPKEHTDLENISLDTSDDKIPTLTNITDASAEHSDQENTQAEIQDDKLPTLPDIVDVPTIDSIPENISQDTSNDDNVPTEYSNSENTKTEIPDDEPTTLSDIDESPQVRVDSEKILQDTSNDESLIEQFHSENTPTDESDDELPTVDSNQKSILQDIPTDELVASMNSDHSSTEYSRPDDKLSATTNVDDSPKAHPDPENISLNTSDDELPPTTEFVDSSNIKFDLENILMNIPDDELPSLTNIDNLPHADSNSANILMNIPDNELPTIEDIVESSNINLVPENIQPEVRPDSNNILMSIPDDQLPTIEDIVDLPVVNSSAANILMNIPDDELPTIEDIDSKPKISPTETKNVSIEPPKLQEKLPKTPKVVEAPIKQSTPDKSPSKTSSNELEDSFEHLKTANIPVPATPEKPTKEPSNLTALRTLISQIVDNDDDDDDFMSSKKDTSIVPKNINTVPEQVNPPNVLKTSLSISLTSLSDDTPEDIFNDTPAAVKTLDDEPSIEETYEIVPTMSVETKRASIVNTHSIPSGAKINHINCSSTYIYFCTVDRKIFYAKLNPNNLDSPLNWQQHTDLGEQLVVSDSNKTVWRLHNKTLYSANDPIKFPPIGSHWNKIKLTDNQPLLSISINDQCGWFTKEDGTLWLLRMDDPKCQSVNVTCPFNLNTVFCFSEKVGVSTSDGEILIRAGCTQDFPEGGGWIFIEHNFGPIDDFVLLTNSDIIAIVDKKHHFWVHQISSEKGFYQVLCDDGLLISNQRCSLSVNSNLLCWTDCTKQMHLFSDTLTGVQWNIVAKNTRLQRLIAAFANEDFVWALTTDRMISSSNGTILEKPRQAQFITHATFVPHSSSENTLIWSLDESCGTYVRPDVKNDTEWEQANQIQFEWGRRLINIVCNNTGVWAVDDEGSVYFRHGHMSANQGTDSDGRTVLPPAWITVPGKPARNRSFTQVFCGPADWMVYVTDNKQNVYAREGTSEENRIGTSWKVIEDCSALELAISEHTLWLLTSFGEIQCRENISVTNPIGTRSTTLSGFFLSLTVSMDDSQVWALDSKRNLLKLDRLTVLFEK